MAPTYPTLQSDVVLASYKTSDATIRTGKALFYGMTLTAGADTATATIYDNTSAVGTVVSVLSAVANTSVADHHNPVSLQNGIHIVLTGNGESATTYYIEDSDS